jgi:hypothetical protein
MLNGVKTSSVKTEYMLGCFRWQSCWRRENEEVSNALSYRRRAARSAKNEKSLRETLSPLKSFKTAKSGVFRAQRFQRVSKTHDFAGETISFRFWLFSFRAK